jgi:hypothetical protein
MAALAGKAFQNSLAASITGPKALERPSEKNPGTGGRFPHRGKGLCTGVNSETQTKPIKFIVKFYQVCLHSSDCLTLRLKKFRFPEL